MSRIVWTAFYDYWQNKYARGPRGVGDTEKLKVAFESQNTNVTAASLRGELYNFAKKVIPDAKPGGNMYLIAAPWPAPFVYTMDTSHKQMVPSSGATPASYAIDFADNSAAVHFAFQKVGRKEGLDDPLPAHVVQVAVERGAALPYHTFQLDVYLAIEFGGGLPRYHPAAVVANECFFPPVPASAAFVNDSLKFMSCANTKKRVHIAFENSEEFQKRHGVYFGSLKQPCLEYMADTRGDFPLGRALYSRNPSPKEIAKQRLLETLAATDDPSAVKETFARHRKVCSALVRDRDTHAYVYCSKSLPIWAMLHDDLYSKHDDDALVRMEARVRNALESGSFANALRVITEDLPDDVQNTEFATALNHSQLVYYKPTVDGVKLNTPQGGLGNNLTEYLRKKDGICLWGHLPFAAHWWTQPGEDVFRELGQSSQAVASSELEGSRCTVPVSLTLLEKCAVVNATTSWSSDMFTDELEGSGGVTVPLPVRNALIERGDRLGVICHRLFKFGGVEPMRRIDALRWMALAPAEVFDWLVANVYACFAERSVDANCDDENGTIRAMNALARHDEKEDDGDEDEDELPLHLRHPFKTSEIFSRTLENLATSNTISHLRKAFDDVDRCEVVRDCLEYARRVPLDVPFLSGATRRGSGGAGYRFHVFRKLVAATTRLPAGATNAAVVQDSRGVLWACGLYAPSPRLEGEEEEDGRLCGFVAEPVANVFTNWNDMFEEAPSPNGCVSEDQLKHLNSLSFDPAVGRYSFDPDAGGFRGSVDENSKALLTDMFRRVARAQTEFLEECRLFERAIGGDATVETREKGSALSLRRCDYANATDETLTNTCVPALRLTFGDAFRAAVAEWRRRVAAAAGKCNAPPTARSSIYLAWLATQCSDVAIGRDVSRSTLVLRQTAPMRCLKDAYSCAGLLGDEELITYTYTYVYMILFHLERLELEDLEPIEPGSLKKHLEFDVLPSCDSVARLLSSSLAFVRDQMQATVTLRVPTVPGVDARGVPTPDGPPLTREPATGAEKLYSFLWTARDKYLNRFTRCDKEMARAFVTTPLTMTPLSNSDRADMCASFATRLVDVRG